jgi:hypothetical protein
MDLGGPGTVELEVKMNLTGNDDDQVCMCIVPSLSVFSLILLLLSCVL